MISSYKFIIRAKIYISCFVRLMNFIYYYYWRGIAYVHMKLNCCSATLACAVSRNDVEFCCICMQIKSCVFIQWKTFQLKFSHATDGNQIMWFGIDSSATRNKLQVVNIFIVRVAHSVQLDELKVIFFDVVVAFFFLGKKIVSPNQLVRSHSAGSQKYDVNECWFWELKN